MLRDNFRCNAMWHKRSVAALVLYWGPAESDPVTARQLSLAWARYAGDIIMLLS